MPVAPKKVLFAAGGTGGHLFPAQALAEQLIEENAGVDLLFAGAALSGNAYFDPQKFRYCDIVSTTPFRGGFLKAVKSFGTLIRGIWAGLRLLSKEKPDLVVGFGSFHAFPVLCAAALKRIPLVLFESNAIPGKVVRLFSKRALFTGIYFSEAKKHLKGKTVDVEIPLNRSRYLNAVEKQEARSLWKLDPDLPTLLVFGGSQGSKGINEALLGLLPLLKRTKLPFQLIHFTGDENSATEVSLLCRCLGILAYVKKFEPRMQIAWSAADIAICRAGAMTLSEVLLHEVPAILVPYPLASDQHQLKNAQFLEKEVGGAIPIVESALTPESLFHALIPLLARNSPERAALKSAIIDFKTTQKKADLGRLIQELVTSDLG